MSTSDPRRPADPPGPVDGAGTEPAPTGASAARATPPPPTTRATDDAFPVPQGPRTTGAGGHVLGVLVGLVLTLIAFALLALGQSRIIAGGVGEESVTADPLGIVLVTLGAVLAALVALLAVRTSAIPFTGGLVALLIGAAYLFAPVAAHRETVRLLATQQSREALLTMVTMATVGTPFALGLVLLATGTAASLVRRRGIEVGAYRARTADRAARDRP